MRLLPVLLFLIASVAECLKLNRVLIPPYKSFGEDALLKCEFELGRDLLYAVKWYKDNEEFFRYVPRYNPPIYTHTVEGVRVDKTRSNDKRVLLRGLNVRSSGGYRCEVSAEAPSFSSIIGEGRMTVVYLPKDPPQITGQLRAEYEVGNVLDLNCTSPKSYPPAKLSWYINDSPIHLPADSIFFYHALESPTPATDVQSMQNKPVYGVVGAAVSGWATTTPVPLVASGLMVSSLRLQLTLESHHFGPKGTAKVRCVARISPLFWQDGDEKILSGGATHGSHQRQHSGSNQQQHQTRHGRKKTLDDVNLMEEVLEEGEGDEGRIEGEENHAAHQNRYRNSYGNNNNHGSSTQHRGSAHQGSYQGHRVNGGGRGGSSHSHRYGYRGEEEEYEEEDEDEEEYYGLGLPTFQKEALVLVRGAGCSSSKPAAVSIILAKIITAVLVPSLGGLLLEIFSCQQQRLH